MLHFTDPLTEDPEDPLAKLSTFLADLQKNFKNNYTPEQNRQILNNPQISRSSILLPSTSKM